MPNPLFANAPTAFQRTQTSNAVQGQWLQLLLSMLQPGAFGAGGAGQGFFGAENFSSGPSPEMQTFNTARPILEGMLTGTGPQFERDIAMANQTGGRFSSGNAIMRGEALGNLFKQRTQTAQTLGMLGQNAGGGQRDQQAQRLQLLAGLLGMGGQFTTSQPQRQPANNTGDMLKLLLVLGSMIPTGGATAPLAAKEVLDFSQ